MRMYMKALIAGLGLASGVASAQPPPDLNQNPSFLVQASWTPPTLNSNGTPLTNLAGFIIYYHTIPRPAGCTRAVDCAAWANGVRFVRVTNPALREVSIMSTDGLQANTDYFFSATAYNTNLIESAYSNEAMSHTPDVTIPGAPGVVTANITFPVVP